MDDLLEKGNIKLPPSKLLEEAGKINDPKYCRYHRVISQPLEKCTTLKEHIMQLDQDGKIILDLVEATKTNRTIIWRRHCDLALLMREELVTI